MHRDVSPECQDQPSAAERVRPTCPLVPTQQPPFSYLSASLIRKKRHVRQVDSSLSAANVTAVNSQRAFPAGATGGCTPCTAAHVGERELVMVRLVQVRESE